MVTTISFLLEFVNNMGYEEIECRHSGMRNQNESHVGMRCRVGIDQEMSLYKTIFKVYDFSQEAKTSYR
jgi:hypothetical protein